MTERFEDLQVWQKAKTLTVTLYKVTEDFPRHEIFGLTSQIRRAAVSIVANIAEGSDRRSANAFANFLDIALGSASELRAHIYIAEGVGYIAPEQKQLLLASLVEITRMLNSLYYKIKQSDHP